MDDRGLRRLVAAAVIQTVKDGQEPQPPAGCSRGQWEAARELLGMWERETGRTALPVKARSRQGDAKGGKHDKAQGQG